MNRIMRRAARPGPALALAGLGVLAVLAVARPAGAEEIVRDFHESWDVTKSDGFWLEHDDGDVTITPWDQDVLDVKVTYRANWKRVGVGSEPEFTVEAERDDAGIRVRTLESGWGGIAVLMIQSVEEYRIEVRAPEWMVLDVRGDDGDVRIEGWRARVRIRGNDGDVELAGCLSSSLRIAVDDGDVDLDGCAGSIDVTTEDGDVRLEDVAADELRVFCDDGDVTISLAKSDDFDGEVRTEDGDVSLSLPSDLSIECLLRTDDGTLRIDLPSAKQVDLSDEMGYVELAGRDGRLRVETDDGDIRLRER